MLKKLLGLVIMLAIIMFLLSATWAEAKKIAFNIQNKKNHNCYLVSWWREKGVLKRSEVIIPNHLSDRFSLEISPKDDLFLQVIKKNKKTNFIEYESNLVPYESSTSIEISPSPRPSSIGIGGAVKTYLSLIGCGCI
ncbi:MAG: hypothetical protein V1770_02500 [bacterium]